MREFSIIYDDDLKKMRLLSQLTRDDVETITPCAERAGTGGGGGGAGKGLPAKAAGLVLGSRFSMLLK